jgi:hypothetical protein
MRCGLRGGQEEWDFFFFDSRRKSSSFWYRSDMLSHSRYSEVWTIGARMEARSLAGDFSCVQAEYNSIGYMVKAVSREN